MIESPHKNKEPDQTIRELLEYRDSVMETCLVLGRVGIIAYEEYTELAKRACAMNPLAEQLPAFTMSLLNKQGSYDGFENSVRKELHG